MDLTLITPRKLFSIASFTDLLKNLLPIGYIWKNANETMSDFIESFAVELNRIDQHTIDFQTEIIPGLSTSSEMLSDWENLCLLPDEVPPTGTPESERQDIVQTKYYTYLPGPTEAFFTAYAANLNITITSYTTAVRFRVGTARVGDRIHGENATAFIWVVNYSGGTTAERAAMKTYFERLKPAHTSVDFIPAIP